MSDLVVAEGLVKNYAVRGGTVAAVDGVSLRVQRGTTLALVGESGCGKSTTGRLLLALERPDEGAVEVAGQAVHSIGKKELRELRRTMQPVFQDPYDSLNGRMTVGQIVAEPLRVHKVRGDLDARVRELLEAVTLAPELAQRYPHELSGGQRQRVAIARAIALDPEFLVCDEPVSALDVSVQAQVVNLLRRLQDERGITYLFISHDLALVRHLAHRVAVMYLGRIVEEGDTEELFADPRHPYTQLLLAAAPRPRVRERDREDPVTGVGEATSAMARTGGCSFAPRCPLATDRCRTEDPALRPLADTRAAACHYAETARVGAA
ncbi:oligopeptide/dipeptide ABC transporter ATP-binding protein [Amycolatopsis rhabdoformis]|uniref:Oligopeptide/dipeptide ABC transporter ATP-binding protein n=1 Tax=Amycolatopsis rhabdoformis TaxID=1448059 RepID=A0ABZ1IC65_9PSEU|nr:oligopeptide/dipeptide ABC transporter ATP-binding protein [Amycolatopsis rhabdoformis]WSE31723.1 oligopeptide/dipeptide ABC transporter ATP-binding protein [Amycolatopsis rhabdoformis]